MHELTIRILFLIENVNIILWSYTSNLELSYFEYAIRIHDIILLILNHIIYFSLLIYILLK